MDKLYIIIPAYNESKNIEKVINDWYMVLEKNDISKDSKLVVVDDGSKDDTFEKANAMLNEKPMLCVKTKANGGHGSALLYGYNYAIENNADWIFQTDSDGQTNPDEFKEFWESRKEYDAILGNRQETRLDGASRKFVENVLRLIIRIIFKVKIPDANAPFRLMKTELVKKYIKKFPTNYNLPNVMLTTYFVYFKEKVKFLKISFKPRQAGKNSINIKKITKIGLNSLKQFKKFRKDIKET